MIVALILLLINFALLTLIMLAKYKEYKENRRRRAEIREEREHREHRDVAWGEVEFRGNGWGDINEGPPIQKRPVTSELIREDGSTLCLGDQVRIGEWNATEQEHYSLAQVEQLIVERQGGSPISEWTDFIEEIGGSDGRGDTQIRLERCGLWFPARCLIKKSLSEQAKKTKRIAELGL